MFFRMNNLCLSVTLTQNACSLSGRGICPLSHGSASATSRRLSQYCVTLDRIPLHFSMYFVVSLRQRSGTPWFANVTLAIAATQTSRRGWDCECVCTAVSTRPGSWLRYGISRPPAGQQGSGGVPQRRFESTGAERMTALGEPFPGAWSSESSPNEPSPVAEYPEELECDVATIVGRPLRLRPVRANDAGKLMAFHARLSPDSIYRRYFVSHPVLTQQEVDHFTQVDYQDRLALVIVDDDEIVAICRYERLPETSTGEVAFIVRDDFQHLGLGHILLDKLAKAAWSRGLTKFSGVTLRENRGMISIFEHSGFPVSVSYCDEEYYVSFSIDPRERVVINADSPQQGSK